MFFMKRRSKGGTGNSTWVLSDDHPILDLDDTLPLTDALGELSSLPPDYHTPVSTSLIQSLQDATRLQNQSDLEWFNTKQAPSNRLSKFKSFVEQCGPNEMVWIYTRYREVIFSMLYATFSQEVEYLNTLPERFLSPKLAAMSDLWMPFPCLHHLIELMPRLFASGWQQKEMENMLIVLLDHGNNQDVRALGFHFLCLYMAALQGNYSETIADLFTNSICLRAFSYVDMPAASRIASNIMCAIGSGIEIVDIGCGQRAIVGFHPGRASICPVLQDITHTINPQGVLALRMLKNVLSLVCYLASLISDPRSAYTVYISLGTIKRDIDPFQFNEQTTKSAFDLPQFAPMLALSAQELKSCLSDIYRLFCKAYLLWIYPNKEEPLRSRHVRRVPIHALRMFIGFMLNNLVPQYTFMISDKAFAVPYIEKDPQNISNIEIQGFHSVNNKMLGDIQTIRSHAYDALRCLMLDYNLDSASFFIDILRLSLQALPDLATQGCPKDSFDFGDVLNSGYTICLGALTIIRMWLVSKEAYRPAHLLVDNDNVYMLSNVIADYMEHVYGLIRWLVAEHKWDQKKLVLLYNALIIHRIITHLYSHHLPHYVKKIFLDNLQGIVVSFLQIIPGSSEDETAPSSYESCALTMLTESLVSGLLMLSNQTEEIITKFRELYSTETKWTSHLNVWCNVLRALTIARGRHILHVEERVLIQESMFSGQRQRRGMSKVDAYMNELDNPIYHLELDDTHDILDTATPFNITSNLVWNTMRLVFDAVNHDAQAEKLLIKDFAKVRHKIDSKQRHTSHSSPTSSSEAISSVYSGILASESKDLCQFSTSASKDVLSQAQSIIKTPQRVFRIQALSKDIPRSSLQYSDRIGSLPPDKIPVCARASQDSTSRPNYKASPSSGSLWKMIKQPFRKSKESFKSNMSLSYSRRNSAESGQIKSLDDPYKNKTVDTLYRTSDKTNRAQSTDTGNCRKGAEALQSSKRSYSRQRMPESSWEGMRESVQQPDNIASMEIEQQNQSLCPVGPALINADMLGIQVKFKSAHHHHKGSMRGTGIDAQKAEIALSNSQAVHSKIILRGMVSSWDLYRAVLDCSRYTPDNDDVMLNTTWWIAEMATTYSTSDYRGRLAQIAMFRIGCHCSDHISSRVLFLRSRHAINIDQIQVFLVECRLALSLGISGSRLLLPTLDRGLRRIFLQRETYQGDFPDQAVHGAATLVVSMATMLSVGRSLAANHETQKVRKLEESNMADNNEFVRNLAGKIGAIEKCKYPIIYDPLGNRDYHVDWVDGGPIFVLVIRELITLLVCILIKAPELITRMDAFAEGVDAECIRDFLVDRIILACADPQSPNARSNHQYNQKLASFDSEKGIELRLEPASYSQTNSISLEDFMAKSVDDQSNGGNTIEALKQTGEILYITLLQYFDEYDRGRYQGAPGSSLVVQDALEHQVENNDSVADMLDQDENKAAGSSNDVFGNVLAFVESEMEALNNSQLSNANSASSGSSKKSMNIFNGDNLNSLPTDNDSASSETDSVCNPIEPFSSGPISPLKVNLFRSLMQHKMAFNYNNTMPCYFLPLAKSESLYRDIRSLDRIHAHETIKVALLYVGPGQWNEVEILSNTVADTSASYQSFINSLGWQVNLTTFHGYTGKLEQCGTDGTTCPYFAEDGLELVFHEVTSMPNYANDARRLNKKRHIGNDHVHIIWNESRHTYRPETISGDFGNVQIHIRPLEPGEYGINMYCDDQIRPFGPLTDGMVVSAEVLPAVVRTTAINGHRRATQAFFRSFTHPYVIRQQNINRIVEKHIDRSCNGFGAAVYDNALHTISIVDTGDQPTSQLAQHLFFKQVSVDVLLYPCQNIGSGMELLDSMFDYIDKAEFCAVSLDLNEFSFSLGKERICGYGSSTNSNIVIETDTAITHEYMITHAYSIGCAGLVDKTKSVGGREMLKQWLVCPLQDLTEIHQRQDAISLLALSQHAEVLNQIRKILPKIKSVRMVCARIRTELLFSDLEMLSQFCSAIVQLYSLFMPMQPLPELLDEFLFVDQKLFAQLGSLIADTVDFEASRQEERVVVASGASNKVDHLRDRFDKLEIMLMDKSPGDIYTQIVDAESEVCLELQSEINCHISDIAHAFDLASRIDCLQSLAALATLQGYCQPKVDLGNCVHIAQGHHPVLAFTSSSQQTISNNMNLMSKQQCLHVVPATNESQRTLVLAGPNASGKSIFLKQSGLIVYMAHIGCHVPALQAVVGLTDRIMVMGKAAESLVHRTSALGADLATVASMIELSTPNTFILLDEFGRGTSPADGMGLLCGVLASLSLRGNDQPAVLAVTHFHEIIVRGVHGHDERADTAYAIECARNAGVPHRILRRAQYILNKK
ncbi:hypothetical protein EDC05_000658 [Coemansia umbellata]|uniref:Rap-GAP domain-containing protein n=1 Tax=Coemansia umbellata TaxID=1424467 RepID=A0ABQ8PU31_9FUNG|nr:hypothetical protein EDC05_000658 [Coemansia umbellata]